MSSQHAPRSFVSPPVWDLAHIAAYEELWVWCRAGGGTTIYPDLQAAYDAFETPRPVRSQIRLLDPSEARRYLDLTRDRTLEVLDGHHAPKDPGCSRAASSSIWWPRTRPSTPRRCCRNSCSAAFRSSPSALRRPTAAGARGGSQRIVVPAGTVSVGAEDDRFAYDCERPAHPCELAAYAIARTR